MKHLRRFAQNCLVFESAAGQFLVQRFDQMDENAVADSEISKIQKMNQFYNAKERFHSFFLHIL